MKPRTRVPSALSTAIGLVLLSAAATSALAQDVVLPVAPSRHEGHHHGWGHHSSQAVFPRTFSYQYDSWFNRPRHTRYVDPHGNVIWRTTVRGLPLGTPWPSH